VRDFRLPDLGEGVTEAEVERWLVQEGDSIEEDAALVEVITDKASAEIPSPFRGVVARIHVAEGETVSVGAILVSIDDGASSAPSPDTRAIAGPSHDETALGAHEVIPSRPDGEVPEEHAVELLPEEAPVQATPAVRRLARALGVDLSRIPGSGPGGRILAVDVEQRAASRPPSGSGARRVPLRGVRKAIANRMTQAHLAVPSVTHVEECDVTELEATRRTVNARGNGIRLTYLPFIVKACAAALKEHPALNASLDDETSEIVLHDRYDIGVAVDTPEGLLVPVVRDADEKSVRQIAAEIDQLAGRARSGSLTNAQMTGSTFTVTSPGRFGGLMATPIVFHPQAAILGAHRAIDRPVVRDGQVVVRRMMNLSITFDHRILDGMTAARFALAVAGLLEHPEDLPLEDA
jgi:pyruvate/2-oxoglutarate dehydrogenase complex dihydrolipoamide acyltransferase (E2) component